MATEELEETKKTLEGQVVEKDAEIRNLREEVCGVRGHS